MDELLTKQEVMKQLGICRSTFERWSHKEKLPVIRIGINKRYILKSDFMKWVNSKKTKI